MPASVACWSKARRARAQIAMTDQARVWSPCSGPSSARRQRARAYAGLAQPTIILAVRVLHGSEVTRRRIGEVMSATDCMFGVAGLNCRSTKSSATLTPGMWVGWPTALGAHEARDPDRSHQPLHVFCGHRNAGREP